MEASTGLNPVPTTPHSIDPLTEKIKQRLLKKGVYPTPKIIHTLRKKELQKSLRKSKKSPPEPLTPSQNKSLSEELHFQAVSREYREFNRALDSNPNGSNLVGKPWEPLGRVKLRELGSGYDVNERNFAGKLNSEHLRELGLVFKERKIESLGSFLDDDVDLEEGMLEGRSGSGLSTRRRVSDAEAIRVLVERLSAREITAKDWKFTRMMKQSGLQFTEGQMLRIVGGLGERRCWKQAMEVVEFVYGRKEQILYKSRFVYTKLLSVLGKARRAQEALRTFKQMRGDCHTYPDMAAYRSIAATLGQAGMVRELMRLIEDMKTKPPKTIKNMQHRKNWDPTLQPDVVVFNSVLNACVPSHQWKGVSWVFEQMRKGGVRANSATYGLAMEVMLNSHKYDLVHEMYQKMKRSRESPTALTYKILVRTFWKEGKVDEAIHIVREMEQRGIIGSASVYYELACCLCNKGRWQEAMMEIEKLKKLRHSKPLSFAFTGMILSSLDGGHVDDCASIFDQMQDHCSPDIGTVNAMLKVYGRSDMFIEAKELFEKVQRSVTRQRAGLGDCETPRDPELLFTYSSMLQASGQAHQWEYFEYVYQEMCISEYQLDQGKHAALLVEASKAGKWHLLEHAFDTTLEAGEIPHPELFSEMVCQAMVRGDYEKAAAIVSAMVHAPFQLNMKDWTSLFEDNKDRIFDEHLTKLSDILHNHDVPEGSSASEVLKALRSICGQSRSGSNSGASIYGANSVYSTRHQQMQNDYYDCDKISLSQSNDGDSGEEESHVYYSEYESDEDETASSYNYLRSLIHEASHESAGCSDEESSQEDLKIQSAFDEEQFSDVQDSEVDDCNDPELPSANEILQSWKELRKQDGITVSSS